MEPRRTSVPRLGFATALEDGVLRARRSQELETINRIRSLRENTTVEDDDDADEASESYQANERGGGSLKHYSKPQLLSHIVNVSREHDGFPVIKSEHFVLDVQRSRHLKNPSFALNDFMFNLRVRPIDDRVEGGYDEAFHVFIVGLRKVLNWIYEEHCEKRETHLFQVVVVQERAHKAPLHFDTGARYMTHTTPSDLADAVITFLEMCALSDMAPDLNETLQIFVNVASTTESRMRDAFERLVGAKSLDKIFNVLQPTQSKHLMRFPDSLPSNYDNKCLIIALVVCNLHSRARMKGSNDERKKFSDVGYLFKLCSGRIAGRQIDVRRRQNALFALDVEIQKLERALQLDGVGPYALNDTLAKASVYFQAQIFVYSASHGNQVVDVFPDVHYPENRKFRSFFLFEESSGQTAATTHMSALLRPSAFLGRIGFTCPICRKLIRNRQKKGHACFQSTKLSCFACRRLVAVEPAELGEDKAHLFCVRDARYRGYGGGGTRPEEKECVSCGVWTFSKSCEAAHTRKRCGTWVICKKCKKAVSRKNAAQTKEQLLATHICGSVMCKLCYENYDSAEEHHCRMKAPKHQTYYQKIAVVDFESRIQGDYFDACLQCLERELAYQNSKGVSFGRAKIRSMIMKDEALAAEVRCLKHVNDRSACLGENKHHVNLVSVVFEQDRPGIFSRVAFADNDLELDCDCVVEKDVFSLPYLPEGYEGQVLDSVGRRPRQASRVCASDLESSAVKTPIQILSLHACDDAAPTGGTVRPASATATPSPSRQVDASAGAAAVAAVSSMRQRRRSGPQNKRRRRGDSAFILHEAECSAEDTSSDSSSDEGVDIALDAPTFQQQDTVSQSNVERKSAAGPHYQFVSMSELKKVPTAIAKYILWSLSEEMGNSVTHIAHNFSRYDGILLVRQLFLSGVTPRLCTNALRLLSVEVGVFNIRWIDSQLFISGGLDSFPARFGMPANLSKGFFPFLMNQPRFYNYAAAVPSIEYFESFNDTPAKKAEKERFVAEYASSGKVWNFRREILEYVHLDTEILTRAVTAFLKQSFEMQAIMQESYRTVVPPDCLPYLHAFSKPFLTIPMFCYHLYKIHNLPKIGPVYSLRDSHGFSLVRSSVGESEYVLYLQHTMPNARLKSKYTSIRPHSVGRIVPDAFDAQSSTAYFYQGCYIHGHGEDCSILPAGCDDSTRNYFNQTFGELRKAFARNVRTLLASGIANIEQMWECKWNALKQLDLQREDLDPDEKRLASSIQDFINARYSKRPVDRLCPRAAVFGGRVEALQVTWSQNDFPDEEVHWVDYVSLYPSICMLERYANFPIGKPQVLINPKDLAKVSIVGEHFCYLADPEDDASLQSRVEANEGSPLLRFEGVIHCSILPPRQLHFPYLAVRLGGKSIFCVCYACAKVERKRPCNHKDERQRAIVGCYTAAEIAYCVTSLGYRLLQIYEVLAYFEYGAIFATYMRFLASYKLRFSGWPEKCADDAASRSAYCDEINSLMGFTEESLKLSPANVSHNKSSRDYYKLCQNSLLGKLSQNNYRTTTVALSSQEDLSELIRRPDVEVCSWFPLGDRVLQMRVQKRREFLRADTKSNCCIGAYVCSNAKMEMDRHFRKVIARGCRIMYTDTDSMVIAAPRGGLGHGLPMSPAYGHFTSEVPADAKIEAFHCLSAKNYAIMYRTADGEEHSICKVRGFTLTAATAKASISVERMRQFAAGLLRDETMCTSVGQFSIRSHPGSREVFSTYLVKCFSNSQFNKRIAILNSHSEKLQTLPYGYTNAAAMQ